MTKITLLSVVVASLLLVGCNDDKSAEKAVDAVKTEVAVEASKKVDAVDAVKTEVAQKTETLTEKATKVVSDAKEVVADAKEKVEKKVSEAKEAVAQKTETLKEKATEAVSDAKEVVAGAKESVEKKVSEAKDAVAQKVTEAKEAVSKATETKEVKAPAIYSACAGCHGKDGKLKALGKSAIIAGQAKEDIITKINGYKAGTRNVTGMGSLMKGQVGKLTDANIEEIATYLSAIK